MDPEAKLQPEKEGHEFNTYCFEELNETSEISPDHWIPLIKSIEHIQVTLDKTNVKEVQLLLTTK